MRVDSSWPALTQQGWNEHLPGHQTQTRVSRCVLVPEDESRTNGLQACDDLEAEHGRTEAESTHRAIYGVEDSDAGQCRGITQRAVYGLPEN